MAIIFASPYTLAYHVGEDILINGVQIYHDVEGALTAYYSQDYYSFGLFMGNALSKTLLGKGVPNPTMAPVDHNTFKIISEYALVATNGKADS